MVSTTNNQREGLVKGKEESESDKALHNVPTNCVEGF